MRFSRKKKSESPAKVTKEEFMQAMFQVYENHMDYEKSERYQGELKGRKEAFVQARKVWLCAAGVALSKGIYRVPKDEMLCILGDMTILADEFFKDERVMIGMAGECGLRITGDEDQPVACKGEQKEKLCSLCLFGDQVSNGGYDCEVLDTLTSGKTKCDHYRER